ncbi:hypothetical protein JW979_01150 [bacterium]|nr:hypothetical protein [candidate division CSSED10-310 bacterium]
MTIKDTFSTPHESKTIQSESACIHDPASNSSMVITDSIPTEALLIGICTSDRHPTLSGRVKVEWTEGSGQKFSRWLPCLKGVEPSLHDRLLVSKPKNYPEGIVLGILDGFHPRSAPEKQTGPSMTLKRHESVCITSLNGEPLLKISMDKHGPVVQLMIDKVQLEFPGELRVSADSIGFLARKGEINLEASDDVIIKGETIALN